MTVVDDVDDGDDFVLFDLLMNDELDTKKREREWDLFIVSQLNDSIWQRWTRFHSSIISISKSSEIFAFSSFLSSSNIRNPMLILIIVNEQSNLLA